MMGQKKTLSKLEERSSPQKVSLGDDYQYPIKGVGEASYKLDSDGQVLMWPKGKNIEDAIIIGEEEGGLYKLKGHAETTLVHDSTDTSSELWN